MFLGLFGELFVYSLYCLSLFKSIEMAITHVFFFFISFYKIDLSHFFPSKTPPRLDSIDSTIYTNLLLLFFENKSSRKD